MEIYLFHNENMYLIAKENQKLDCKSSSTPIDSKKKLSIKEGTPLENYKLISKVSRKN
jgi:hypothetical protein